MIFRRKSIDLFIHQEYKNPVLLWKKSGSSCKRLYQNHWQSSCTEPIQLLITSILHILYYSNNSLGFNKLANQHNVSSYFMFLFFLVVWLLGLGQAKNFSPPMSPSLSQPKDSSPSHRQCGQWTM